VITPNLYPFYPLLWAYYIWFTPTSSGVQLGHKTRLGHCNMHLAVIVVVCVFLEVSLTALYFRLTYCPPPSELVLHLCKCLMFLSALGNIWHLHECGTSSGLWGSNLPCWVYYCKFLGFFFQFGENTQWIMDGFVLGRMCARCVDIDHFCTKAARI
jgi:hypothetical protein